MAETVKPWEMYKEYTDEQLDKMEFSEIFKIRNLIPPTETEAHNRISKFEHQAYAREAVKENPALALPYLTFPPVYAAGKAVGLIGGRSQPSLEQVGRAYRGIAQGVEEAVTESKPWMLYKEALEEKPWEMFKEGKSSKLLKAGDRISKGVSSEQMLENVKGFGKDVASQLPIIGNLMAGEEAAKYLDEGDKVSAILSGLGAFIPVGMIKPKPYFHGTRKVFEEHEKGLIFLTEEPHVASTYASGGGGQRGFAKTAFYKDSDTDVVYEQKGDELIQVTGKDKGRKLPADVEELQSMGIYPTEDWDKTAEGANVRRYYVDTEKTLNLRHQGYDRNGRAINEGAVILAELDPKGSQWATQVISEAKKGNFDWSTTKYPEAQKAWKEILIPQLEKKGYDSIEYWDDMHPTLAVFSNKSLKSTLPKTLATKNKEAQRESLTNILKLLEEKGKVEEANKIKELLKNG